MPDRSPEHEQCSECGFDGSRYSDEELLGAIRSLGPQWRALVTDADVDLRIRPRPDVWSALEYLAHSRDITALHAFGVEQALTLDEPAFPAIDGDELIASAANLYADVDPARALDTFEHDAARLAALAEAASPSTWWRGVTVGDSRSDVRRLLEHTLHDSDHHLGDVRRGLLSLRADH